MQTIVELPEYLRQAASVLGEDEKSGIINTLARNPLFLLTLFAKGDKANLSKSERNELAKLAQILRSHYAGKRQ